MHILQPKHTKLKTEEVKKLLEKYNISLAQIPKIRKTDSALPENTSVGDVFRIDREEEGKKITYFRVVVE